MLYTTYYVKVIIVRNLKSVANLPVNPLTCQLVNLSTCQLFNLFTNSANA